MYGRHWDVLDDLVRRFHCVRPAVTRTKQVGFTGPPDDIDLEGEWVDVRVPWAKTAEDLG